MNSIESMLVRLIEHFTAINFPYMVVGSLASSALSVARTTLDADIVISPSGDQLDQFLNRIETEFYFNRQTAHQAVRNESMFNVIDYSLGCKADLIPLKKQAFEQSQFQRRRMTKMPDSGLEVWTSSAEDTILSKLVWAKMSESERQYHDVMQVARVQWTALDFDYLSSWATRLGINEFYNKLLNEPGLNDPQPE
ncbi:MAG: hypothetical protein IT427_02880 [Pirellulales bacterium]|nr:hypothetical protein [Pirellulales bacterium]